MAAWDWVRKNSTKKLHPNNSNNNHTTNQSHINTHSKQHSDDNLTDLQNNNDIIELLNGWRNEKKYNQNTTGNSVVSPINDTFHSENSTNSKVNIQQREEYDNVYSKQNIQLQPAPRIHNHKHNTDNQLISTFENDSASTIKQNIIPYDKNQNNSTFPQSGSSLTTPNSDFSYNEQAQNQTNGTNESSFYESANSSHTSIERNSSLQKFQTSNSKYQHKKLDFSNDNLKEEIILDLGLPRNKRGSNLSELTHIDSLCNEYNDEIAKQYYSKPRPLRKPTTRLSPSSASSRLKNLNINVNSNKSIFPHQPQPNQKLPNSYSQNAMNEFNKRTTSQRSPSRSNFQNSSVTQKQKIIESENASHSSNQNQDCKVPQTPSKVSNPFYRRQHSAVNKFNNDLEESTNGREPLKKLESRSNAHINERNMNEMGENCPVDSPASVSRNSSITSKLSNLDSPINASKESELIPNPKKPSKFDVCRSNAPSVYIYNNHSKKNKTFEGKDKLKFNRTSSVYALEPVEDFKNIDINENPLPSIGNLLSSTEETFTIPDNPYALDTFNPYEYSR